ncbi:MAG: DNA recombination protein RmuC, partial [Candidatus Omnitrophica bacterium]|nr:DNA recombination protein RmuC [Candidatus Omnitrophota bacterium]
MNALTMIFGGISLLLLGIYLGWFLRQSREHSGYQAQEKLITELRQQIAQKENALELIRTNLSTSEQERAIAETKLKEASRNTEEQKKLLERAEERLTTTFQALSGESLKSNNRAFIELAKETLETVLSRAKGEFGEKEESIKNIVGSLEEALKRYEGQVNELERKRAADYGGLENQIKSLITANQQLQKETGNLVTALRRPEVRGRWGEVTLKRVVELAGMSEHCDFTEQVSVNTEDGRIRPDMIVHLP